MPVPNRIESNRPEIMLSEPDQYLRPAKTTTWNAVLRTLSNCNQLEQTLPVNGFLGLAAEDDLPPLYDVKTIGHG